MHGLVARSALISALVRVLASAMVSAAASAVAAPVAAQEPVPACADVPAFHALDFWVGEWEVRVGEEVVGRNTIARILDGCALTEHWRARGGGEGRSLFYFLPGTGEWKQVWVTGRAMAPGGVKEKRQVDPPAGGGVRFQGTIVLPDGATYLDRTTLTELDDGRVRQHIEISTDAGDSWRTIFDAEYVPVTDAGSGG